MKSLAFGFINRLLKADIFCDSNMADFQTKACGIDFAGVIALGLIDPALVYNESNLLSASWWEAALAASPQEVFMILNTRGEMPAGTVVTAEGFGRQDLQVTGASRTATVEFENMIDNYAAVEGANRRKWFVVLFTNADIMYHVNEPVTFFASPVVGRDKKAGQFYSAALTWDNFGNPKPLVTPAGLIP
jgi:hypothetical protein